MKTQDKLLDWAIEIQSLAQAGLTYGKDKFDLVRYERLRDISAEMIAERADISIEKVKELFCNESGYQTPKVTTRITVVCLLCYAGMKSFSFFTGANHMAIEVPKGIPGAILSSGFILPLNVCVGIIVGCTMFSFYSMFSKEGD